MSIPSIAAPAIAGRLLAVEGTDLRGSVFLRRKQIRVTVIGQCIIDPVEQIAHLIAGVEAGGFRWEHDRGADAGAA